MKIPTPYLTDEEDRVITQAALSDPDNLPITDEDIESGKVIFRCDQQIVSTNRQATVRLDPDVAVRLKADGRDWQTRANTILRKKLGL